MNYFDKYICREATENLVPPRWGLSFIFDASQRLRAGLTS
jgi:hypothetical protein